MSEQYLRERAEWLLDYRARKASAKLKSPSIKRKPTHAPTHTPIGFGL